MTKKGTLSEYVPLLDSIKTRIRRAQVRATLSANAEMLLLYWDVGCIVTERQTVEGWGAGIIPRLAADIKNDMPEIKGSSTRNFDRMIRFHKDYPLLGDLTSGQPAESSPNLSISPPLMAKLTFAQTDELISPAVLAKLPNVSK